jgi:hypothetical protein
VSPPSPSLKDLFASNVADNWPGLVWGGGGNRRLTNQGGAWSDRGEQAVRRPGTSSGPGRESDRAQSVSRTVPPLQDALGAPESESRSCNK